FTYLQESSTACQQVFSMARELELVGLIACELEPGQLSHGAHDKFQSLLRAFFPAITLNCKRRATAHLLPVQRNGDVVKMGVHPDQLDAAPQIGCPSHVRLLGCSVN